MERSVTISGEKREKITFLMSVLTVLAAFAALLYAPAAAINGAKQGIRVCAEVIVPSLLPFLVLSGLVTGLGLPRLLMKPLGPLFERLFAVSGAAAAPFLLGLTGGYPVGAAATAELVRRGELEAGEGERLLGFCNNTGPAFILGAVGGGVFHSAALGLLLYLCHILAAVAVGLLGAVGRRKKPGTRPEPAAGEEQRASFAAVLPGSVRRAVASTANICGFVVFFAVLSSLLNALGLFSTAAGVLATRLGLELRFVRALLLGLLELGNGVSALQGLDALPRNLALAAFLLGFGGLSVQCQTLAAIEGTGMSPRRGFLGRLLHGAVSAGLALLCAYVIIPLVFC